MSSFKRHPHNSDIARAIERVIVPTVRHLDELVSETHALDRIRIEEVGRAKPLGPRFLGIVEIHDRDPLRPVPHGALHHAQPNAPGAEDSHAGAFLDARGYYRSTVAGRDPASKQADAIERGVRINRYYGDVCDDGVLRQGAATHKMQQVLAAAGETRRAIGHHAFALRGTDFAAEVCFARFAELAFFAFRVAGNSSALTDVYSART